MNEIAVRKETKNKWEKRTPLNPSTVQELTKAGFKILVEDSQVRIYPTSEYEAAGARIVDTTNHSPIVIGIKEPPLDTVCENQIQLCFAHVIKGQSYNMPLLRTLLERKATLIDYEPMVDDQGDRIAAIFSRFAGFSGTIETLKVLGEKLQLKGVESSFLTLKQPYQYARIEKAKEALRSIAPLKDEIRILIVGEGNVGQGARMVCEELQIPELSTAALEENTVQAGPWFCVVDARDIVRARDGRPFDFATYVEEGTKLFDSTFERLLGKFDVLIQGAYWDERYPRQLPLEMIKRRSADLPIVVGDVSCDIDGTVQCTTKATSIDEPAFTFNAESLQEEAGINWSGPTVMSIDNLPCELPADASDEFSALIKRSIPSLATADLSKPLEQSGLSAELQRGTIVYKGELTPKFAYLKQYL